MEQSRWLALMDDAKAKLTDAELDDGWHWCYDWDGLLVGPGMMEMDCCQCEWINKAKHDATPKPWLESSPETSPQDLF